MTLTHLDEEVVRSRHPRGHRLTTNPATSPHAWRRRPEPTTRRHEDPMLLAVRTFVVPAGPYAGEQIIAGQYWCRASHWLVKTFPDAWAER